jgi:hypothetical protein
VNALTEWQSFYILVGSAAGALIGLQFVLMALIAELPKAPGLGQAAGALATPTVVHFSAALLLSAVLVAPWHEMGLPAFASSAIGVAGSLYILVTAWRMRRQTLYRPDLSDWIFYVAAPLAAYAALAGSAYAAASGTNHALFGVGAAALLLMFAGIRNAWDSVTYHVFVQRPAHLQTSTGR